MSCVNYIMDKKKVLWSPVKLEFTCFFIEKSSKQQQFKIYQKIKKK